MREIYIRKLRYEDAKQKLEREIHNAFMEGETLIEVVHGIGEGKLKQLTLDVAVTMDFIRVCEYGDLIYTNPGSTKLEILSPGKQNLKRYKN